MKKHEAIKRYGSQRALAKALSKYGRPTSQPAVSQWGEYPPLEVQFALEIMTAGRLMATRKKS